MGENKISYPFPGMNPWLKQRGLWKSVHSRLITAIADTLAPALEPRYFVDVELHTYISTFPASPPSSRYSDVTILDRGERLWLLSLLRMPRCQWLLIYH